MSVLHTQTLVTVTCWCGIAHAIPEDLNKYASNHSGANVYCPLGHTWYYTESFEKKLKRERERHQATRELLAAEERSHQSTRGHVTRLKKRASAGVCPCCHRTFQQLARHMKSKHPGFVKEA